MIGRLLTAFVFVMVWGSLGYTQIQEEIENIPKKPKLEKIPKSLFLVKKTKINADVGEPQFYPSDAQLRTIINDPLFHDAKKFE